MFKVTSRAAPRHKKIPQKQTTIAYKEIPIY